MTNAATDSVKTYLNDIAQFDLLSPEKEKELARQVAAGSASAKEALINHNLRLVIPFAKHYKGHGLSFMDLIQEGNAGLLIAAERFDVDKGFRFSTYASYWIKQSISKAIKEQSRNIRIPVYIIELIGDIKKVEKDYLQKYYREPSKEEVAKTLNIPLAKIKNAYSWMADTSSIDIQVGDDEDTSISSFIEDDAAAASFSAIEVKERNDVLNNILDSLTEKEKTVVMRRFGISQDRPEVLEEIAEDFGVSKERIRQIEAKALKKLRNPARVKKLLEVV